MDSDLIEKLLQTTGLSCEDLLSKLQQYRSGKDKTELQSASSDCVSKEETNPQEECATTENDSVILETKSSPVDDRKLDKIHTQIETQINVSENSVQEAQNKVKSSERHKENTTTSELLDSDSRQKPENIECINCEDKCQPNCDDEGEDSVSENIDTKNKNLEIPVDTRQSDESVEDSSYFDSLKRNKENKLKISDYLENIFNCRKSDRVDKEDIDKETSATIDDPEHHEENNENSQINNSVETTTTIVQDAESSQHMKCVLKCNEASITDEKSNILEKESSENTAEIKNENSCAADEKQFDNIQKSPSINEHNYSNIELESQQDTSSHNSHNEVSEHDAKQNTSPTNNNDVPKSEDSLRNILKLQLSSLRNMKKSSGYLPDLKKTPMFFHNLKKKRKSCDINSGILPNTDDDKEENDERKINSSGNPVVSLCDETDLVILSVTGGVDRLTPNSLAAAREERMFAAVSDAQNKNVEETNLLKNENSPSLNEIALNDNLPRERNGNFFKTYKKRMYGSNLESNHTNYKIGLPNLTVKKDISENFKKDPGVNKSVKNSEKSPFVSDSLEDFLSESAQLKISYAIPKLGAEEGITENTKKSPFDHIANKVEPQRIAQNVVQKEPKLVKAKTLAEMRRHFEKMKARKTLESNVSNISTPLSRYKKNKAIKKYSTKINEKQTHKSEERDISSDTQSSTDNSALHRNSIIMFDNKKLRVVTKVPNKCLGTFYSKINKDGPVVKKDAASPVNIGYSPTKKPSLLSSMIQNKSRKITYKPGPLCKKAGLQNAETRDQWITEVKTLPKVYLEVVPEVDKPVDSTLVHLLPIFDEPIITEERANFALSVLKQKNSALKPEAFTFYIPYNYRQEKMVVRKPYAPAVYRGDSTNKETDPASEIASILNDLITYVETKEIEDTLIKEDDITVELDTKIENTTKIRKQKRRNRLDLELLRLNCKVIDVATNETQDIDCTKPFCRLGCVCKSLLCESVFSNHCQLVGCMFGCKCTSPTSSEMATSNSCLSVHTVNHLEDKAKKNLAKVEREFTQTLIHTDNDAILVGTAKMRRSSKPPKKYTDYVAENVPLDNPEPVIADKTQNCKMCNVALQKLDLDQITPLCLVHNLYNCHCKGETIWTPTKTKEIVQIPKIRIVKTKEDQHKAWLDSCARIRKVFPEYKERNKSPLYNEKLLMKNLGRNIIKKKRLIVEPSNRTAVSPNINDSDTMKKPNKRKQSFNVREDTAAKGSSSNKKEKEFALQRRKKKIKPSVTLESVSSYSPVFDGEIKVSLRDNEEMLKVIGPQHESLEYLRILPWTKLIGLFHSRKISIWTKEDRSSVLLCNTIGHFPPKNFIDIRKVRDRSEIIEWILTDSLPLDRPRNLMHLILTPKKFNFLIAGYCLKKINDKDQKTVQEDLNEELTTDPLRISADLSFTRATDHIENEVDVDADQDDNNTIAIKEIRRKVLPNFVLESKELGGDANTEDRQKPQSVLISKILRDAKGEPLMARSSPNRKQIRSNFKSLPFERRLKIVRPEMWVCKDNVNLTTLGPMSLEDVTSVMKENSPNLQMERRYVKLKSILNTVPSIVPDIDAPITESTRTSDADRFRAHLSKQRQDFGISFKDGTTTSRIVMNSDGNRQKPDPGVTSKEDQETKTLSSVTLEDDFVQLKSKAHTGFAKYKEKPKKKVRDPLEITVEESRSPPLVLSKSPPLQTTLEVSESVVLENYSNVKHTPDGENTKKRRRDPLEITTDEPTSSQQSTSSVETSPKQKHIIKRVRQNSPVSDTEKNRITAQQSLVPSRTLKCTHKDMFNKSKTLILTNKIFPKRKLFLNKDSQGTEIVVPLPRVLKNLKWRMIYLNSDFSFLTFTRANYSVKYTDLMDVVKMSGNIKSTITLRNKEFSDHYKHPQFGIFCVPEYQDRLFIGPFSTTENHNIETLRYLQGRLIDTQIFNKMVGKKCNEKDPVWVFENSSRPINLPKDLVIDITEDDDVPEITVVDLDSDSSEDTQQNEKILTNCLLCPPFVEELTSDELKSRHINRYIMTNIPHLGYFGACQRDSKAIEIFWPNGVIGYRFPNVILAKNLLTHYLSQIFSPIPQDFKINVIIMTNIDVHNNKPIDPKYFSHAGPYLCGEFGIYEKHDVPNGLLKQYQISSINSLLKSHAEAQANEETMIRIFGLFLMSNEELRIHSEPEKILQWAISEVYILKKLALNYESEKNDLQDIIRRSTQTVKEKRKEERNDSTNKNMTNISETIEIEDSDEDNQPPHVQVQGPSLSFGFERICESGKIRTIYNGDKDRSLLKSNWHSVLKNNDKEKQNEVEGSRPVKPIKISLNNSNIILNKNKLLVTKLK